MLHNLRQIKHCIIILTIVTFSFGFEGDSSLCFMPDGNVHLERSHSVCSVESERPMHEEAVSQDDDRALSQSHCLDVSLARDTTDHLQRNFIQLPAPVLTPLGSEIVLSQTAEPSFRNTPAVNPPPQLVSLQGVVLLI